jgi:serine-type D-Ala-D-Ala carboxypeptidase/endopeptidase (penicillin-binding protein 4)
MRKCIFAKASLFLVLLASLSAPLMAGDVKQQIDAILANPGLKGAMIGVHVIDVADGSVIYSYHADDVLSVASNAKLVTTSAILDALGPNFELTTSLIARGEIKNGTLYGDLILVGKGDPSMSTHWTGSDVTLPLQRFAKEALAAGITNVTGDVVVDDFYFDRQFLNPSWPKTQWIQWYEAPVAAMAFNDNCVDVTITPGSAVGAPAALTFVPAVDYVNIVNTIKTSPKGSDYSFWRTLTSNEVTAKGTYCIKAGTVTDEHFTVYDPSMFLGAGLKKTFENNGIKTAGTLRLMAPSEEPTLVGTRLVAVNRVTLADVVKYCNLHSQNLYAEMLFKTLGKEVTGEGSWIGGSKAVARFLEKVGARPGTYVAADGSGLARETRYSAAILTNILKYMYTSKGNVALRDSMPLAGYDGTMEKRLTDPAYRGKVRAKTGYILGTSSLSGYVVTANNKVLAFSIVFNKFKGGNKNFAHPVQDTICKVLVDSAP